MSSIAINPVLSTTAAFGFEGDPGRVLAVYRSLGCVTCQYYRRVPDPFDAGARPGATDIAQALRVVSSAGLRFDSIHGVFGENVDPSSSDADHRRACLQLYEEEGRLATDLGGPAVVVHPAAINPGRRVMTPAEAAAAQASRWGALDAFLGDLAEVAERGSVTYLIENLPFCCPLGHDPAELARHVLAVGSPRIRMCFDTGHAHITGGTAACSTADVGDGIRQAAAAIGYMHIHDNDRSGDQHLPPGEGTIPWEGVRGALRSSGTAAPRMLELFLPLDALAQRATARLSEQLRTWLGVSGRVGTR